MNEAVKKKVLDLQSRREHSQLELKQKLSLRGFQETAINQAIEWLIEKNWQSDQRFTESYVDRRMRQGYGPLRLESELRDRGISDPLIQTYVWEAKAILSDHWLDIMIKAWRKKFHSVGGEAAFSPQYGAKAKQARFLSQRGFTEAQIRLGMQRLQLEKSEVSEYE